MSEDFLYAKKLTLPSTAANVVQSLNMAAALSQCGANVIFFPAIKAALGEWLRGRNKKGDDLSTQLQKLLQPYGLDLSGINGWHPLWNVHRGLFKRNYEAVLNKCMREHERLTLYARDVEEAYILARFTAKNPHKKPFIFEMHKLEHAPRKQRGDDWQGVFAREKKILNSVNGLVVTNSCLGDMAGEYFGYKGPVLVEPNGFNPSLFRPLPLFTPEMPWPGPDDTVTVLYIGKFIEGKGTDALVESMAYLPQRFHLRLVGSGGADEEAALRAKAAAVPGGAARIHFAGQVAQRDLRSACMGAHISVIPQQPRAQFFSPIKLYESLALGLPTICTPLEIFAKERHLVHPAGDASPRALAEAIRTLAGSPNLAERLRDDGIRAAARFTWQARASRILEFCKNRGGF